MLQLYNEKPVSISMKQNKSVFNVEFCNIKMKLNMCQFKLFHNYLMNISENLTSDTNKVDLLLVRDSLNVTVSIDDATDFHLPGPPSVGKKRFHCQSMRPKLIQLNRI